MNFYNFLNFNSNIDIKSNFAYNFYEEGEGFNDDKIINSNNKYNSKEINVTVEYKSDYSKSNQFINEYVNSLNTDYLKEIHNTTIEEDVQFYLNNFMIKKSFLNKNVITDEEWISKKNNDLNINISNFFESLNKTVSKSKKINVNRKKISFFEKINKNNDYYEEKIFKDNNDFYSNNDEILENLNETNNFLNNMVAYNEKSIYSNSEPYYFHVGIIVVKFKKNQNQYLKQSVKFLANNNIIEGNEDQVKNVCRYNFNDIDVKYAETYLYAIYPVYNITLPKFRDFHILQDVLYCDTPVYTKEIVCKENIRPLPPTSLSFKFIENSKKILITWKPDIDTVGDVKGYQIFKRFSLDEPFKLVKQIEYHLETDIYDKNLLVNESQIEKRLEDYPFEFVDDSNIDKIAIYAICAIDAHGYVSNYSSQIGVKYNYFTQKSEIDLVSSPGAPIFYPNLLIKRKTKFFDNDDKINTITPYLQNISKITLYATPDFAIINNNEESINNNFLYKENYKFNIFKVENSDNYIDNIKISNFTES